MPVKIAVSLSAHSASHSIRERPASEKQATATATAKHATAAMTSPAEGAAGAFSGVRGFMPSNGSILP